MFRFDENLFDLYKLVEEDGELSWSAIGAGRMPRAPTVSRTSSRRSARSYDLAATSSCHSSPVLETGQASGRRSGRSVTVA
jgi:hypothetical protein